MIRRHYPQLKIVALLALAVLVVPSVTHADVIGGIVYYLVIQLFGMLVAFGAMLLNVGIDYFVIGFGGTFNNTGIGVAVNDTWAIIRDFVNLGFIFGLVYIGIKMILDTNSSNARRWLAKLIMAALLVNFSLFATKFVIDIGNRVSAEIAVAGLGAKDLGNNRYKSDVGSQLMHRMGITSAFNLRDASDMANRAPWGYIFGIAILFMIAAFVFAAGGILLIIRFVTLIVYLIMSPLMFVGWIIPGLPDQMNKYWKDLLAKTFFAPIYFVFLYFSFQIMDGLQKTIKGPSGSDTTFAKPDWGGLMTLSPQSEATTVGTLPFFILICVLLLGSLKAASSLGKGAADWSQKTAGKMVFGTVGRAGRNTLGRGANKIANSDSLKDMAATGNVFKRNYARTVLAAGQKGAAASFDPRGVSQAGLGAAGSPVKGGYAGQVKKAKEDALSRVKAFGEVDIDSEEGKKRVAAREAEIKNAANNKKKHAETGLEEFEKDKLESEFTLTSAIQALTNEIRKQEQDLEDGSAKGILTEKDKADSQARIDEQKLRLSVKRENLEAVKVKDEAIRQRNDYSKLLAGGTASEQEIAQARDAYEKAEAAHGEAYRTRVNSLKKLKEDAATEEKNAEKVAKGEVKYSRQIGYLKQQQNSIWNKKWSGRTGGAGGAAFAGAGGISATGGAAAGILGLPSGIVSGLAAFGAGTGAIIGLSEAGAYGDTHKEIVKAIEKEYGKDGSKKFKKESESADAKKIADALKKAAGDDGAEKTNEGGKKE